MGNTIVQVLTHIEAELLLGAAVEEILGPVARCKLGIGHKQTHS